jgi:uncharacterized protein
MAHEMVAEFLGDPATHGLAGPVEMRRTHAALVFLAGQTAWKIKRPVVYDYLDFSTPERRRAALERELELNRPTAPQIYDRIVAITRQADGRLALDGDGEPVEWALRMWRFPVEAELSRIAARGALDDGLAARLGREVARMHARAPRRDAEGEGLIGEILEQLASAFAGMSDALPAEGVTGFNRRAAAHLDRLRSLLRDRGAAGWVRRCHGDLHLRNIVVLDGVPLPFDALEFDERLGTMDVLYDLAFLLMDLRHEGLERAANIVLNRYLHHSGAPAHLDGLAALPLFLAVRAAIRAMVAVQRSRGTDRPEAGFAEAVGYLRDAGAALDPPRPVLVAVGGISGSGKTVMAASLAPGLGAAPGAVHLRSDLVRKALLGVEETARLPKSAYTDEISARIYATLREHADRALRAGHSVVLDAVHLNRDERAAAAEIARRCDAPFVGLWLEADADVLEARVAARRGDASDADREVVRRQLTAPAEVGDWPHIDASGPPGATLARAREAIARVAPDSLQEDPAAGAGPSG